MLRLDEQTPPLLLRDEATLPLTAAHPRRRMLAADSEVAPRRYPLSAARPSLSA